MKPSSRQVARARRKAAFFFRSRAKLVANQMPVKVAS
jgi:hypothetical protein